MKPYGQVKKLYQRFLEPVLKIYQSIFLKIIEDEELEEKEVSISSKKLFENQNEFINSELINSKKGGRPQKWYNLDAIISIGYRINSKEATQFRRWANKILKEYMIK